MAKKVKILNKYSDFTNVFLKKKAMMILEQTKLNEYKIKLEKGKQPPYKSINSLSLLKLED